MWHHGLRRKGRGGLLLGSCSNKGVTISVTITPHSPHIPRNGMQWAVRSYAFGESGESGSCARDSDCWGFSVEAFCKPQVGGSIPLASSTPTFGWASGYLSFYRIEPLDRHHQ